MDKLKYNCIVLIHFVKTVVVEHKSSNKPEINYIAERIELGSKFTRSVCQSCHESVEKVTSSLLNYKFTHKKIN
jgi:hypothetical protein